MFERPIYLDHVYQDAAHVSSASEAQSRPQDVVGAITRTAGFSSLVTIPGEYVLSRDARPTQYHQLSELAKRTNERLAYDH